MKSREQALGDIRLKFDALEEEQRRRVLDAEQGLADVKAQREAAIDRVKAYFKALESKQAADEILRNPPEEVRTVQSKETIDGSQKG